MADVRDPDSDPTRSLGGAPPIEVDRRKPGDVIGRYVLLNKLGSGGMGDVWAAHDPKLDRKVALKFLHAGIGSGAEARLFREAQAMARLPHPNVVPVHDVGTDRGEVFIAMELVDGGTVSDWIKAQPRTWREVLRVFVEAGRGLAAAHAAGLVHRDFKPTNLLIDTRGRVLVTDFGVVCLDPVLRADDEAQRTASVSPHASETSASLATPLTLAGNILGTPVFMPPEQFEGLADARSDQFSFCVSLYWALYGELPFTLRYGPKLPPLAEPRSGVRVPGWIRAVLVRGLATDPTARHPSMDALLVALGRDPAQARRRWLSAVGALVLITGVLAIAYKARKQHALLCGGASAQLAGVWNDSRREAVHRAFLATGKPYAADLFGSVGRSLDDYGHRWAAMRTEACEATRLRGEQSEELLDLRMACLDQRRAELTALVDVFTQADGEIVARAAQAASGLGNLAACANTVTLRATVRPPADAQVRAQVDGIRGRLARAKALQDAGDLKAGIPVATAALTDARKLAYTPVVGESLFQLGSLLDLKGDEKQAEETLMEASAVAQWAHDDLLAARTWVQLQSSAIEQAHYAEAQRWARLAEATIDRAGADESLRSQLFGNWGNQRWFEGRFDDALDYQRRSLALREKLFGPDHVRVSTALINIGNVLDDQGKPDEAIASYRRALAIAEKTYGSYHPSIATTLNNIGAVLIDQARYDEALGYVQRAMAVAEKVSGREHRDFALAEVNVGVVLALQSKLDEALVLDRHALAVREKIEGPDHPDVALSLLNIADVLVYQGQYAEAMRDIRRGLAIREKAYGPEHHEVAMTLNQLGGVLSIERKFAEALTCHRRALAIQEKVLAPNHSQLALSLGGIGRALLGEKAPAQALAPLERALTLQEHEGKDEAELAHTRFDLAQALSATGKDRARASDLAQRARTTLVRLGRREARELASVDAWLAHAAR